MAPQGQRGPFGIHPVRQRRIRCIRVERFRRYVNVSFPCQHAKFLIDVEASEKVDVSKTFKDSAFVEIFREIDDAAFSVVEAHFDARARG